jgi:hypothetical protein
MFLLEWLGLAFLIEHVASKLGEMAALIGPNVKLAWEAGDNSPLQRRILINTAARGIAQAIGKLFHLILEAIVMYLFAKGAAKIGELAGKLKASRLGQAFGSWIERNWQRLMEDPRFNPRLRPRGGTGGGAGSGGNGLEEPPPTGGPPPPKKPVLEEPAAEKPPNRAKWRTDPTGPQGGKPTGKRTVNKASADSGTKRSVELENGAADRLANAGYKVEQNPKVPGPKNPDYRIEGEIFDCYAPQSSNARNIVDGINKKVGEGQADRIVLNLEDSGVSRHELREALSQYGDKDLKEIILIDQNGNISRFYP